jgi:hypothetical protein
MSALPDPEREGGHKAAGSSVEVVGARRRNGAGGGSRWERMRVRNGQPYREDPNPPKGEGAGVRGLPILRAFLESVFAPSP